MISDSECERSEVGFTSAEDKRSSIPRSSKSNDNVSSDEEDRGSGSGYSGTHLGVSVFDFLDRLGSRSPCLYNPVYCPELQQTVLRPFSHLSDLQLWDYYVREELRHGPYYDPEYAEIDATQEEEGHTGEIRAKKCTLTQGQEF